MVARFVCCVTFLTSFGLRGFLFAGCALLACDMHQALGTRHACVCACSVLVHRHAFGTSVVLVDQLLLTVFAVAPVLHGPPGVHGH